MPKEFLPVEKINEFVEKLLKNQDSIMASSIKFGDSYETELMLDSLLYRRANRQAIYTVEKVYKKQTAFYLPFDIKIAKKVIHEVKIQKKYYDAVVSWMKSFELRKLDRNYQVGHYLHFTVINEDGTTETTEEKYKITYILKDVPEYGLQPGYGILSITRE